MGLWRSAQASGWIRTANLAWAFATLDVEAPTLMQALATRFLHPSVLARATIQAVAARGRVHAFFLAKRRNSSTNNIV